MACPECGTVNAMFAVIDQTRQYVCKQCGEHYYTPDDCLGAHPKPDGATGDGTKPEPKGEAPRP